ncbi:phospholipase A1-II 3-like [Hordeum vulgare subsp. vulgare]|uniref:Phospholipase A1 n=1 Tax=Hordeum vulgare subsp. vulgare TaxID=112509 RepID=A0A8I6X222_HORVV|nr:phospholipase A1-II 3-like [Hordeum vulgare subsp. vulgare]
MYHYLQLSVLLVTILSDVAIAQRWREISGGNQWSGLLDPLDIDVRRDVIRFGELAQATSDAFITDPASPYAGACRYSPASFFSKVQASDPGAYRVTRFIYATSSARLPDGFMARPVPAGAWSTESNWMGYVAVATDRGAAALGRRDIVVAWRATKRVTEWASDLDFALVPAAGIVGPGRGWSQPYVHRGFLSVYTSKNSTSRFNKRSAREQVLTEVRGLLDTYKKENCSISITGHSLGGALSTLNAIDLVANGFNVRGPSRSPVPVTAIHFGGPRVGDEQFKKAFHSMAGLSLLRVRNVPDIVPTILPPVFYSDVGVELLVDTRKSPYLKEKAGPAQWHNLEGYLHGVAGTHGAGDAAGFSLVVDRDLALVNKEEDALKDDYPVPAMWWAENNKGMVKNATGHWVLHDHEEGNLAL